MTKNETTYWVEIHLAGDLQVIEQTCRQYCMKGLCVTVRPERFIYTGGQEDGAVIGLINYPRFPKLQCDIWEEAVTLAEQLREAACQHSVLVMGKDNTMWFTTREE